MFSALKNIFQFLGSACTFNLDRAEILSFCKELIRIISERLENTVENIVGKEKKLVTSISFSQNVFKNLISHCHNSSGFW